MRKASVELHEENDKAVTFAQFGAEFQCKLLQALLTDHRWAQQMSEVIRLEYFEQRHIAFLAERFFAYHTRYKCFPSLRMLVVLIKDELRAHVDATLRDRTVGYNKGIKSNPAMGDLPAIKDMAMQFCRRQAMKDALEASIDLINTEKYDAVVTTMRKALAVGTLPSVGHRFFDDIDARLEKVSRECVPTGLPELDANGILGGGAGKGELFCAVASAGTGKSHWLVQMGVHAIKLGFNVVHYTFELNERYVGIRYDSNLCSIASNDICDNVERVKLKYRDMKCGRLVIKEYPTNTCGVLTIRNHLERLEISEGFKPDLIIVDYADIMKSSRQFDSLRHELKLVYEELRTLAQDVGVPIWTASQGNRAAISADVVGLENLSEAYGKAMVADFIVSISRKPLEKATNTGRLFIAKNRFGRDGIVFPVHIDTSQSLVSVTSAEPIDVEQISKQDVNSLKAALESKWRTVKSERELGLKRVP